MNQATATLPAPPHGKVPKRGTVWTTEDLPIIQRLRSDATTEGIDWRTDWKKIGPAKICAVVDELFPGPTGCGPYRAYRIQKLIPVVPEDLPEPSLPALLIRKENPEPTEPVQLSSPKVALQVQGENKVAEPRTEAGLPELNFGRLRRVLAGTGVLSVAIVAAMISYAHQKQLATDNGQTGILADAWPLAVDGLVLSCGIMVATDRLRGYRPRFWALAGFWLGVVVSIACNALAGDGGFLTRAISAFPAIALLIAVEALTTGPTRRCRVVSPTAATSP